MHAKLRLPVGVLAAAALAAALGLPSCNPGSASLTSAPVTPLFGTVVPLTDADVQVILARVLAATNRTDVHVGVVDRTGLALGVLNTGAAFDSNDNIALSLARTTAFFSNSQAPLSSRTVETLGTFHFPPTFADTFEALAPAVAFTSPRRTTTGIAGTPQGPLWQINSTNRGANIATAATEPDTLFNISAQFGNAVFFPSVNSVNVVGNATPSPGITLLPGAVPLFKAAPGQTPRLVGGVGVFVRAGNANPDVALAEFLAVEGASGREARTRGLLPNTPDFFLDILSEGAITIAGILLPYIEQTTRPTGASQGPPPGGGVAVTNGVGGQIDPFNFLIGPRAARYGVNQVDVAAVPGTVALTQADVTRIISQVTASADRTRAQVRLPLGSAAKVIATVVDTRGLILAHFRMEDTLCDAVDVVPAKARSVVYYCLPSALPTSAFANGDTWPGFPTGDPRGIALSTRTLGFLSQPFYPPGIDENPPGPLFALGNRNLEPQQIDRWGSAPPDPGYQNGLTFFPGSVPLYKNGQFVGALGVSGDGVEQNDLIAFEGGAGFAPPPELLIDNFSFQGVRLPYLKFPQTPR
ncbi:MAG: heme-binding protein [Planctomycetota bacterium]